MSAQASEQSGLTRQLAERAQAVRYEALPDDVREIARHSILDFIGLSIVGAQEPLIRILVEEAVALEGRQEATSVGSPVRLPAFWAASINSAAGHVLAYDDVNMTIPGHGTAVAWPCSLALAEKHQANGRAVMEGFVAGFETVCHLGALVEPSHYDSGFHASATIGTFGAAASAGRLMKLDTDTLTHALSLSASMAAGLKGSFGTMVKPFQVSRAAGNGVQAASLAARGLAGRGNMFEVAQGFAATHAREAPVAILPEPPSGYYLRQTCFKYHAACYLAHSPIEAAAALVQRGGWAIDQIASVAVQVNPMCGKVCNLQEPGTAPEIGYSIRMLTAMALMGITVTRAEDLDVALLRRDELTSLRHKVRVEFDANLAETAARVNLTTRAGVEHAAEIDVGIPTSDLAAQGEKLRRKFRLLVEPVLGAGRAEQLIERVQGLDRLPSMRPIVELMAPASGR